MAFFFFFMFIVLLFGDGTVCVAVMSSQAIQCLFVSFEMVVCLLVFGCFSQTQIEIPSNILQTFLNTMLMIYSDMRHLQEELLLLSPMIIISTKEYRIEKENTNNNDSDIPKEVDLAEHAGQINLHRHKSSFLLNHDLINAAEVIDIDPENQNNTNTNDEVKVNESKYTNNKKRDSQDGNNPNIRKNTWEALDNIMTNKNNDNIGSLLSSNGGGLNNNTHSLVGYDPSDPMYYFGTIVNIKNQS